MDVRIDEPGAGEWVMERAEGHFARGINHAFSAHREDGSIAGGIVVAGYLGPSLVMHAAGDGTAWLNRELLWLVFHYAFVQLGTKKAFAPVRSDNYAALSINLRAGWEIETVLRDAFDGAHMIVLSMYKDRCPWLNYTPTKWRPGAAA